jgi:hypothetical protein
MQKKAKKSAKLSLRMVLVGIAIALLLGIIAGRIAAAMSVPPTPEKSIEPILTPEHTKEFTEAEGFLQNETRRMNEARATLKRVVAAAELVAQGNRMDEALVARFKRHAVATRVIQPETFGLREIRSDPGDVQHRYYIRFLFVSDHEAAILGFEPSNAMMYEPRNKAFIFPARGDVSGLVLGAAALHEMVHWEQVSNDDRDPLAVQPPERAEREVAAYVRQFQALRRFGDGKIGANFYRIAEDTSIFCRRDGAFLLYREGWRRLQSAFPNDIPPLSEFEQNMRGGFLHMMVMIHHTPPEYHPQTYWKTIRSFIDNKPFCD